MKDQRGQALVELVILTPAVAALLLAFSLWARIALAKLALVQLTRDTAILLARDRDLWDAGVKRQTEAMRRIAPGRGLARPQDIQLTLQASSFFRPDSSPAGENNAASGISSLISGLLIGKRLTLSYALPVQGLLGRWLPQGYKVQCSVTVLGDAWDLGQGMDLSRLSDLLSGSP